MGQQHAQAACIALFVIIITLSPQSAMSQAPVTCSIDLQGVEDTGPATAGVLCTGGTIKAGASSPAVLQQLKSNSSGVVWQEDSCGVGPSTCLLSICGSSSSSSSNGSSGSQVVLQMSVQQVKVVKGSYLSAVCLVGDTQATVQDAKVLNNWLAGLLISDSAGVAITNSTFKGNWAPNAASYQGGGALILGGDAAVNVTQSRFINNGQNEEGSVNILGGAVVMRSNAQLQLRSCYFDDQRMNFGYGGCVYMQDRTKLTAENCTFVDNLAQWGGVLSTYGNAQATLSNCTMDLNWGSFGGVVLADDNSTVSIVNSRLHSNFVKDYDVVTQGGACAVNSTATLRLVNVTMRNNTAQHVGGAIAMIGTSANLLLGEGVSITGNTASRGGGLFITRVLDNMTHAALITTRNKAIISDDIGVQLAALQLVSDAVVPAFVPRLRDNKGMLPVRLKLVGKGGLPGSADIQAVLDGQPMARNASDPVTGQTVLNINFQRPPDTYTLHFEVLGMADTLNTSMDVTLLPCGPGEINVTGACNTCPKGSFSLEREATVCERCPAHAVCDGGGIIPVRGFWSSSLLSNQIHRCLYPPACGQIHTPTDLLLYQTQPLDPTTQDLFMAAQCISGHEGNLCGRCSKGHGQRMSALASRCQPCASQGRVIATYLFAALASMLVIKLLCFFHTYTAKATITARAAPSMLPPLGSASGTCVSTASGASSSSCGGNMCTQDSVVELGVMNPAGGKDAAACRDASGKGAGLHNGGTGSGSVGGSANRAEGSPFQPVASQGSIGSSVQGGAPASKVSPGDLLKPVIIYLQWTLVVASVNVEWPSSLSGPFTALSWLFAASSTSTGLDCILDDSSSSSSKLPVPIRKVLFGLLMPLLLLVVLLVAKVVTAFVRELLYRRRTRGQRLPPRRAADGTLIKPGLPAGAIAQTAIVLVFFFLPSLLRTCYALFACVYLDKPMPSSEQADTFFEFDAVGSFWLMDTNQQCFAGYHRIWAAVLGAPLLLLLCCVLPLGVVCYLWYKREELDEPYYLQHYSFLYESYEKDRCWWEGVVALQTCVVVAISVFGATLGAAFQCILLTAAFGLSLILLAVFKPFAQPAANLVGVQSLGCLTLSAQAALVCSLLALDTVTDTWQAAAAAVGVGAAVLLVNVAFVVWVLWQILWAVDWTVVSGATGRVRKRLGCKGASGGSGGSGCGGCFGSKQQGAASGV